MGRRIALAVVALALALASSGCGAGAARRDGAADAPPPTTSGAPARATDAVADFRSSRSYQPLPPPTAVRIAAIGVDSPLELLGRNPDGTVEVPSWDNAGWWAGGPRPGQPGPAVILGHVDSRAGPAVFHRLHLLEPGDEVEVEREDGSVVRFVVERLERHAKEAFPTEAVYGANLEPGLRLITCGGAFDGGSGHYRDNVIVFAQLAT